MHGKGREANDCLNSGEKYHGGDELLFHFSPYLPLRFLSESTVGRGTKLLVMKVGVGGEIKK